MWNSHCWWYAATLGAIMLISLSQQLLQWLLCNQLRLSRVRYRHFPHSAGFQRSHDKCWHEAACLTKNNHKAFWATVKAVQIKFCRSEKRQLLLGVALTLRKSALKDILICVCVFLTKRFNTTLLDSLTSGFVLLSSSSYVTFILTLLQILWAQLLQLFYPVEYGTKITAFCWNCHYQFICWNVFTQCWSLTHKSSLQGDPQQTVLEVLTFEGKESIKLRTLN